MWLMRFTYNLPAKVVAIKGEYLLLFVLKCIRLHNIQLDKYLFLDAAILLVAKIK